MSTKSSATIAGISIDIGKSSVHVVGLDAERSCCGRIGHAARSNSPQRRRA
jgi:hypothetical protein